MSQWRWKFELDFARRRRAGESYPRNSAELRARRRLYYKSSIKTPIRAWLRAEYEAYTRWGQGGHKEKARRALSCGHTRARVIKSKGVCRRWRIQLYSSTWPPCPLGPVSLLSPCRPDLVRKPQHFVRIADERWLVRIAYKMGPRDGSRPHKM